MKSLIAYCKNAVKLRYARLDNFNILDLVRFYGTWKRSLANGANPLRDELPWLTFAVIRFLEQTLTKNMRVFEYGSGGSTLFLAKRVKELVSVEQDPKWAERVEKMIEKKGYKNCSLYLVEPVIDSDYLNRDPSDPDGYVSAFQHYEGKSFKEYVSIIDKYPDNYFDFVIIDGRARPSCFMHAVRKVKKMGFIVLDNSERKRYSHVCSFLSENRWNTNHFFGPGTYRTIFWQTSI